MSCLSFQGKGEVRTYWVVGEDRERRMSRLAPPKAAKSPTKITDMPRPLQKMLSAPSIRFSASSDEYKLYDCPTETDKLLNGMLPHGHGFERDFKPRLPLRDRVNSEDAGVDQFSRRMWFRGSRGGSGKHNAQVSDDSVERTTELHSSQEDQTSWPHSNNGISCQNDLENGLGNFYQETSLMRFGSICEQSVPPTGPPPPYTSIGRRGRSGSGETSV